MYEKYTGLPDTAKLNTQDTGRVPNVSGNTSRIPRVSENAGPVPMEFVNTGRYHTVGDYRSASGERGSAGSHTSSGSSGSRSGGGKRRKKQRRRRQIIVFVSSLVLVGLLALAITVIAKSCNKQPEAIDVQTDAFRAGVYINGADVSGKTIDEVRTALEANETYAINNIAITLKGESFATTVVSGSDMNVTSNLEEVMTAAMTGGANQVYYTKYDLDKGALAQRIDEINATLSSPPTDASFTIELSSTGKPTFQYIDGQSGFGIDVDATAELVHQAFEAGNYQTTIEPALTAIAPTITVDDIKAHTTQIGSYTTTYDFKGTAEDTEEQRLILIPNRAFNVEKCAGLINNQVIKPGRTWSFNDTAGDRTEKNGWKEANGIFGGDRYSHQFGGGVCQVSSTLYNALLECYPNVEFVARRAHSIPSTYVDMGLDATVDSNHIDFKVKNTSEYPLYVFSYVTKNKKSSSRKRDINVLIYGEALPEGVSYKTRTELISETPPGEPVITESKKLFVGEETVEADARSSYVIDVYIDRYLNNELQESKFLYTDTYEGNPLKKKVGIMPTPTPLPVETPIPTAAPGTDELP